ncbi:MAG: arginine--tRNA ligase [Rhodospirillaceae bacterium]|nr:arginine--tRNA ligase [Rhodospirillaceae bacterium]
MNLFSEFKARIGTAVAALQTEGVLPEGLDTSKISAEPPRDTAHGEVSTNAAMVLAKPAGMKPRDLAVLLADRLVVTPGVEAADVAGPGFINLRLAASFWQDRLAEILRAGTDYGSSSMGGGVAVNVEYVSANPTGPMHVGHGRGAVVGDVLASLLHKAGFAVTREYYVNDAGAQVDVLARSLYLRYREALGEAIGEIPEGLYPGEYLVPLAKALAAEYGDRYKAAADSDWLSLFRDRAVAAMMDLIRDDLAAMGVKHDVFSSERALVEAGGVQAAFEELVAKGLIYEGVLEPPKGLLPDDWEAREQTLFRASDFGDDVDRPLKKSDGSWTYFASDIAYHYDKHRRGAEVMIDVMGADHGGYVKRMAAAVKAMTDGKASLDIKLCQMVNLMRDGEPVKMSKRSGNFVTLREVVDDVGRDVVRFIMLTRKNDAHLDFDLKKVTEQSKDNPVFYVQYAHARAHSVLRHAAESLPGLDVSAAALSTVDLAPLTDEAEIALIKLLAAWPRVVEGAAEAHEPHRIAYYLSEVAAAFHSLWNKGRDAAELRFLLPDRKDVSVARVALVRGLASVVASGLMVLGVTPVEEM